MPLSAHKYPKTVPMVTESYMLGDAYIRTSATKTKIDNEFGGVGLHDASQGLMVKEWQAKLFGNDVLIHPADAPNATITLFTEPNITEIALAFDFNMQPIVAYMQAGVMKMRWYDGTRGGYVVDTFTTGDKSPRMTIDDKRADQTSDADVLLFYIRGSSIFCRLLRDRFAVEYEWKGSIDPAPIRIVSCGLTTGYRFQLQYV